MADFGLAAQIGRGGGGGGMSQQQDPQNRMLQMMQLQQLQQNMMLAREQEGRAARLAPLMEEDKRASIKTEGMRQGVLAPQGISATETAATATRAGTVERGVLDYIRTTPPEERAKPERLDALRGVNPGAYMALTDQINAANIVKEKAQTEKFTAAKAKFEFERVALNGMSSLLPAVTDQDSYSTIYTDYKKVDPVGSKIIGPEYTPKNIAAMRARIQDLGDLAYGQDAFGNETATNKRTGKITLLAPATPASPFGNRVLTQPGLNPEGDAPTFDAARTLGAAPPPSAVPGTPYTPPPSVSPIAAAAGEKKTAELQAQKAVDDVKKREGQTKTQDTLNGMIDAYKKLGALGELQRKEMSTGERLRIAAQARLPGDVATAFNFDAGSELTTISNLRQALIPVLTEIMGAKSADAASESQRIVDSLTTGGQSPASIARTLTDFSKKYGLGVTFKPEDLAFTPPAGAAGSARGRAAPAAAQPATPAPAAAKPTLQEFLAKARPANPNASDADLRTYYDRTYGGR